MFPPRAGSGKKGKHVEGTQMLLCKPTIADGESLPSDTEETAKRKKEALLPFSSLASALNSSRTPVVRG